MNATMTESQQDQLRAKLDQFIGTEEYHRFSAMRGYPVLTDGAHYLAEKAGAYWLMDVIASHLPKVRDDFAVAQLQVNNSYGRFTLTDDCPANTVWAKQTIPYTDFPLDSIKLYCGKQEGIGWVIMLTSEY